MVTDRFSMAHSIEARTPFLDNEFVEFVFLYRHILEPLAQILRV